MANKQGNCDPVGGKHTGDDVSDRDTEATPWTLRGTGDAHETSLTLHDCVVTRLEAPRPRVTEA